MNGINKSKFKDYKLIQYNNILTVNYQKILKPLINFIIILSTFLFNNKN